jgi:hypothetical protein
MSRHSKNSHVFVTKAKPKAKQSTAAKNKKEKRASLPMTVPQSDTTSFVGESVDERAASSVASSSSEDLCETSIVIKSNSLLVCTSESHANSGSADNIIAVENTASATTDSSSDDSGETEDSEESEKPPAATSDTSDSDEHAIEEDKIKVPNDVATEEDAWGPAEDNIVVAIAGLTREPVVFSNHNDDQRESADIPSSSPLPDEDTSAKDTAAVVEVCSPSPSDTDISVEETGAAVDVCSSPAPDEKTTTKDTVAAVDVCPSPTEEKAADEVAAADDVLTKSTYKGAGMMTPMGSMGPSIMFNGLFGTKDISLLGPVPSSRQDYNPSSTARWDEPEQVPAYATRSHASWFSNPTNTMVRGVQYGNPCTVAELQRVAHRKTVSSQVKVEALKQPIFEVADKMVADKARSTIVSDDSVTSSDVADDKIPEAEVEASLKAVERRDSSSSLTRVYVPLSGKITTSTAIVTDPLLDCTTFRTDSDISSSWSDREPIAEVDPDFSDDEDDDLIASSSSVRICVPFSGKMASSADVVTDPLLDGITFREDNDTSPTWFDRDSIPEPDPDFSDDEDDHPSTSLTIKDTVDQHVGAWVASVPIILKKASKVAMSSDADSSDGCAVRTSSKSSRTSAQSADFHLDNTYLGGIAARNLLDNIKLDRDGKANKEAIAHAYVLCVATEHTNRRSFSPNYKAPGVSLITKQDAKRCRSSVVQSRARLGRISLFDFLKKVTFDDNGMAHEDMIFGAFRQAAVESAKLIHDSKHSSASRVARRISRAARSNSGSSSEQSRGRVRTRTSA